MASKDFREVVAEEEYGSSLSGGKAVKTQKVITELETHYPDAREREEATEEDVLLVNYFEEDDLVEVQHTFEKETPYNVQAALQHADFVITDTEQVYEDEVDLVRSVLWAGPRGVVEDGDQPIESNALEKQVTSSSMGSSPRKSTSSNTSSSSTTLREGSSSTRSSSMRGARGKQRIRSAVMALGAGAVLNVSMGFVMPIMLGGGAIAGDPVAMQMMGWMEDMINLVTLIVLVIAIPQGLYGVFEWSSEN